MTPAAPTRPFPAAATPWRVSSSLLAGAVFGLLVGAALTVLIATRFFGFSIVTVTSGSMAPAIRTGDAAVVRPVSISDVDPGDVVLFEQGGDAVPVLHRVVAINELETRILSRSTGTTATTTEYRLVTQGDSNPAPDPATVGQEELRGEVWFTIPRAGAILGLPVQGALFAAAGIFGLLWLSAVVLQHRQSLRSYPNA